MEDLHISGFVVPKGFITDGATVPVIVSLVFSPTGKYMRDAVLHDYLLDMLSPTDSRSVEDGIFYRSMKLHNVPLWRRTIMYASVRTYGVIKVTLARLWR